MKAAIISVLNFELVLYILLRDFVRKQLWLSPRYSQLNKYGYNSSS